MTYLLIRAPLLAILQKSPKDQGSCQTSLCNFINPRQAAVCQILVSCFCTYTELQDCPAAYFQALVVKNLTTRSSWRSSWSQQKETRGSVGLQLLEGAIPSKSPYSKGQGIRWSRLATHFIKTARQLHTVGLYILLAEKGLDKWNHLHFLLDEPVIGEITDIDEHILLQKMQEPYVLRGAEYMKSWKLTLQINRRTYSGLSALLKSPIPRKQGLDYPRTIKLHVSSSIPCKAWAAGTLQAPMQQLFQALDGSPVHM